MFDNTIAFESNLKLDTYGQSRWLARRIIDLRNWYNGLADWYVFGVGAGRCGGTDVSDPTNSRHNWTLKNRWRRAKNCKECQN